MRLLCITLLVLAGNHRVVSAQSSVRDVRNSLDSLVLQRTGCLGTCPAYRLTVRADGHVAFVSQNREDGNRTESHTRGPDIVRRIELELARAQFIDLPDMVMGESPYCRVVRSDSPTITVSAFRPTGSRSVSYYLGCSGNAAQDTLPRPLLRRLQALADSIDAIAANKEWIRPARCCDI